MADVILSVLAHPDDAEFLCTGTMIRLLREHRWQVHIASMTPGDCGSHEHNAAEISRIRRSEGAKAAGVIGATYHCLEEGDLRVFYNEPTLVKVVRLLRHVRPRIVLTHSPADYMLDHEMTSVNARAACFAAAVPNFVPDPHQPPLEKIPHLYYCDAVEGKDPLGREIVPGFCIDVSAVLQTKTEMLSAHDSQRSWLLKHHGMDHYLEAMKAWNAKRGQAIGVAFAEGFRQHLGHSYPQDNLIGIILGEPRGVSPR
jgi:LmbE family N-acetylglucosaminyl deacetylase